MKLKIVTYQQAWEAMGDDMDEVLRCLENKDEEAIENIMLKHPGIDYTIFWSGENRDIIFTKRK